MKIRIITAIFFLICTLTFANPYFVTENLSSNRFNNLPRNRIQISIWYDGKLNNNPTLIIECIDYQTYKKAYITIDINYQFNSKIITEEWYLDGFIPTGKVIVRGVTPDGVIDGVAFGLYWKDAKGYYSLAQSNSIELSRRSTFVGGWPCGLSDSTVNAHTPQVTDPKAKQQVRMALYGAKYLGNGTHFIR